MPWYIYLIWAIGLVAIAIGFATEWHYNKTHFTEHDDERLEAPKERDEK